jgi:WD40-like Beta Propeller Repeat
LHLVVLLLLVVLFLPVTAAEAAFPGQNGKIAFSCEDDNEETVYIDTVNPDGSGSIGCLGSFFYRPAWSPDGLSYLDDDGSVIYTAFGQTPEEDLAEDATWSPDGAKIAYETYDGITIANADGSGRMALGVPGARPAWSPDGTKIAFDSGGDVYVVNADGSNSTQLTTSPATDGGPNWSPDGSKIAFHSNRDGNYELYSMNADDSGQTRLTNTTLDEFSPAWSPDGTKIAFTRREGPYSFSRSAIWYVNADGSGATQVTHPQSWQRDADPDWQPILRGYVRPKAASPTYISLVPAYEPCTTSNRVHGPPLSFNSCSPPTRSSSQVTIGTADANGAPTKSTAYIRAATIAGDPSTPADEADLSLAAGATDVRNASDLSDYTGALDARLPIRITDRDNTPYPGGPGPGTVTDTTFSFSVPCAATADATVGSSCSIITTADATVPGTIVEKRRTVWALDGADVRDGNGNAFLAQGLFVP